MQTDNDPDAIANKRGPATCFSFTYALWVTEIVGY